VKSRDLKSLLGRVKTWPPGAQSEAVKALREIEEDFTLGPETQQEVDRAHNEALRGEGVSVDDLKERLGIDY
jgi:hypothetical protein